jgi:Rrf2 family protein
MLLNKNTDYAIRALVYITACKDGYVSSSEISRTQNIPLRYLRRILSALINAKYLKAKEGTLGGTALNKKPKDIKISNVIRIFQREIKLSQCIFKRKLCKNRNTCALRKRVVNIEKKLTKEFEKITIANLLKDNK